MLTQVALNFVVQIAMEEAASKYIGPALLHATHPHPDGVERKHHTRAGAVRVSADLFQNGEPDLRQLSRTLERSITGHRPFKHGPAPLFQKFGDVHSNPNS